MHHYEIIPMVLSYITIDKSGMTFFKDCGTRIKLPIVSFYIKGARKNILIDTGVPAAILEKYHQGDPVGDIQSFEEVLSKQGLNPEDIDIVVQTHLHLDHCGYTQKCVNAKVLVQEEELKFALNPHPLWASIYPKELYEGLNWEPITGDFDIIDGVKAILTPGHSPGTQSVAIQTKKGTAVVTGFCCIRENFEVPREVTELYPTWTVLAPGFHNDVLAAFDSVVKIQQIADLIIPDHEPELFKIKRIP